MIGYRYNNPLQGEEIRWLPEVNEAQPYWVLAWGDTEEGRRVVALSNDPATSRKFLLDVAGRGFFVEADENIEYINLATYGYAYIAQVNG